MTNHPWVDEAVNNNALVCQVLLQLQQEISQPPMPPPPPPPPVPQVPEQDKPALFPDWGVQQRRSRRMDVRRPVGVARRSEVIGGSSTKVSIRGATSGARKVEESGRRRSLNRSNASKSKAILPEPSGGRTPTKRLRKLKKLVTLRDEEAMLADKKQRKKEREITKTATKSRNGKESLESNMKPHSQGERRNNRSIFVSG